MVSDAPHVHRASEEFWSNAFVRGYLVPFGADIVVMSGDVSTAAWIPAPCGGFMFIVAEGRNMPGDCSQLLLTLQLWCT